MLADADQRARTLWLRFADRSSTSTRATGNSCAGWQSIAPKKRLNWKVRCVGCGYFAACVPSCCVWFDNCRRGQWYPHKCARQVWAVSANLADKCVRSSWAVIKECMHATVHSYTRDQTRVAVNACTTDAAARGHTFFVQQRQPFKIFLSAYSIATAYFQSLSRRIWYFSAPSILRRDAHRKISYSLKTNIYNNKRVLRLKIHR